MDRGESNKVKVINKYLKFNGETGKFSYYDKDKKENIDTPLHNDPLGMIILSTGYNVSGFDEANECKVFSNEVKYLQKEKLIVRSQKGGIIAEGFYADIKEKLQAKNLSLYFCITFLDETEVNRVSFKGSSFFKVSEALKKIDIVKNKVSFAGLESGTKGKIVYQMPILVEGGEINKEEDERANDMLAVIKANRKVIAKEDTVEEEVEETESPAQSAQNDDLPF